MEYYIKALREQKKTTTYTYIFSVPHRKFFSAYSPNAPNELNLSKYWHNMKKIIDIFFL